MLNNIEGYFDKNLISCIKQNRPNTDLWLFLFVEKPVSGSIKE